MTRRSFFVALAVAQAVKPAEPRVVSAFALRAIAAAHMPHTRTIVSFDPRVAAHFARGGVFEIREYPGGPQILLHDSLGARWAIVVSGPAPHAISLYVPA